MNILSRIYGNLSLLERKFFDTFCFLKYKTKAKVVSIGNLSMGGTGKTPVLFEIIKDNAVLWEIEPAEPYTAADLDWRNPQSRSSLEMNDPEERPTIKQCTDVTPYDTVYVGFPIWWGICPRIINSWLDNNLPQLQGKILIPFATSGSSGIEETEEYLRRTYPSLSWQKGLLLNKR